MGKSEDHNRRQGNDRRRDTRGTRRTNTSAISGRGIREGRTDAACNTDPNNVCGQDGCPHLSSCSLNADVVRVKKNVVVCFGRLGPAAKEALPGPRELTQHPKKHVQVVAREALQKMEA